MNTERLREQWQQGRPTYNLFLGIPSPWTAELVGHTGFESVTLDMQHGLMDFGTAVTMLQAIQGTPAVPLARLRWNEPSHIMQMLDAGAAGLICPMINTAADVQAFLGACRFPPEGIRSFGPIRAGLYHAGEYRTSAYDTLLTFAMIETAAAVENLEAIAAVPGLSGLFVGPYDLSISLGFEKTADVHDPALLAVLDQVLDACTRHQLFAGIHTGNSAHATLLAERGYQLISCGDDSEVLAAAARRKLDRIKG